ncbi:MAG: manganese efflux pump MntP family protein [Rhodospirillales bacterium]|nr:manganese efflux pump MntP family protein [Rhodospirillales bacterium]MBO6787115.1 manganese efflux pump MntP family protein [Rhodospirillales bacterium]
MSLLTALAVGLGLAADAFAASLSRGCLVRERVAMYALLMACLFGGFQALMPWIGWQAGAPAQALIEAWDHWVAFGILFAIGAKTIHEGLTGDEDDDTPKSRQLTLAALVVTAIATSIDALAAGFGFALVTGDLWLMIIVTGVVTFALSWVGVHVGCRISSLVGQRMEMLGGAVLILIGASILYQHLSA